MSSAGGSGTRLPFRLTVALAVFHAVIRGVVPAAAQMLEPKALEAPESAVQPCPSASPPQPVSAASAAAVDSLLAAGSRAAILGDNYSAGEHLRQAALLDPGNPVVAYRLARTYQERGESDLAIGEYCRYLLVSPQASNVADVQDRIRGLAASATGVDREEFEAAAREGLRAYDQRRYQAAALAFTRGLEMRADWASGYFNRGLASAGAHEDGAAIADLQKYLELNPGAEDRSAVERHIAELRSGTARRPPALPSPGGVLARGLVVPGLGQFATRRPFGGVVVLAGTAGAAYWGLREEVRIGTGTAFDPFGNPYDVEVRSLERPNLVAGVGVAAGLALAGAAEAYLYARRQREPPAASAANPSSALPRVGLHVARSFTGERMEVGLRIGLPHGRP